MLEGEKSGDAKHPGIARSAITTNVMTAIVTTRIMRTTITAKSDEMIDGGKGTARERARGSGVVKSKSALRATAGAITIGAVAPIAILVATICLFCIPVIATQMEGTVNDEAEVVRITNC